MAILGGATRLFVDEAFTTDTDECIVWPHALDKRGYPQAQDAAGFYKPHRRICKMMHGEPPSPKHHAAHQCGLKSCVNKRHLFWKTPKENEADKKRHGRMVNNRPMRRKLSPDDVRRIRSRACAGEKAYAIAGSYPVTHVAIQKIIDRRSYRDIP